MSTPEDKQRLARFGDVGLDFLEPAPDGSEETNGVQELFSTPFLDGDFPPSENSNESEDANA